MDQLAEGRIALAPDRAERPPDAVALSAETIDAIAAALRKRDRAALHALHARLAGAEPPPRQRKWLGRLAFAVGELEEASRCFVALSQPGPLDLEDACRALLAADAIETKAPVARLFAGAPDAGPLAIDARCAAPIARAADRTFATGDRRGAVPLYELARRVPGGADVVDPARHAEALLASGRPAEAVERLIEADAATPLDSAGLIALAGAAMATNRTDFAADAFARLERAGDIAFDHLARRSEFLIREAGVGEAEAFVERVAPRLSPCDADRLALIPALERRDADRVNRLLDRFPADAALVMGEELTTLGYAILARREPRMLASLDALVRRAAGERLTLRMLLFEIALARQDYAGAAAALARAAAAAGSDHAALLGVKTAELAAFEGRLDDALAALAPIEPLAALDPSYLPPVAGVLAEAKAWPALMVLIRARLPDWFRFDRHTAAVLSATASCDGWQELIEAIDAGLAARPGDPDLSRLRLTVLERLAGNDLTPLLEDEALAALPGYRARIHAKARALATSGEAEIDARGTFARDTAIFYCTDASYLAPAFNSLNSLLMTNARFLGDTAIELFVEPADVEVAEAVAEGLRRHHGCAIAITPSTELIGHASGGLRTRYGIFTGGLELSQSAYYRIFAIERLLAVGGKTRALYIDSDTLVTGEVARIFATLDGSRPLAARREVEKVEVARVEALHGLAPGAYFNSGVLAVDLAHPDLRRALDATLRAVRDDADRLIYHDQCALNLGFREAYTPLPPQYNSFCTSADTLRSPGASGVILHFLDRPKPWQLGYDGPFAAVWYDHWRELARIIDAGALRRLIERSPI